MSTERAPSGLLAREQRRRRKRRDGGRIVARVLSCLLAVLAIVPVVLALGVRSSAVRGWAERKMEGLAREQHVSGAWKVDVSFLPLAIVLNDVRIDSTDGGSPALAASRVAVKPKLFALLSGKIAIDQIEIDTPRVRAVVVDGELRNLAVEAPAKKEPSGPFHAPFRSITLTDGAFDVTLDGTRVQAQGMDLDVASQDDARAGSSFEISVWLSSAIIDRTHTTPAGIVSVDEDAVCRLDGRLRLDPDAVTVHRLALSASADLDPAAGTRPSCKLPDDDKRKIEASLNHLRVRFPQGNDVLPQVSGRLSARAPISLADRFVAMPKNDGWVSADLELRFVDGMRLPEIDGHIGGRDIFVFKYDLAKTLDGEIRTRGDVVESSRLEFTIAKSTVTLTDVRVEPLVKGIPVRAGVDIQGLDFTALMRDLGVHPHSHVQWDVRNAHVPLFSGTLIPAKLDGELTVKSDAFAVYDAPADGTPPSGAPPGWRGPKQRMIGVGSALVNSHVAVRPEALLFQRTRVASGKSVLEGGLVSIGFENVLRIDVPSVKLDLSDIGPLGNVPVSGQADAKVTIQGMFNDPRLDADTTIQNFSIGDIPFGNVTAGHVQFRDMVVDLSGVKAVKGKSRYEMPSGSIDFGGRANLAMDAVVTSPSFDARDFFALWHMEDDPRFAEIEGTFSTRSNVHVALGGPQDRCGSGFVDVDAHARVSDVTLFGEHFETGELDLDYEWADRLAGLYGARVDVHSFNLRKLRKNGQGGSLLGSASIDRGKLSGNVVIQSIPLARVSALGSVAQKIEASASGFARLTGTVDRYALEGDLDVSPALLRGTRFGPSRLQFAMTEAPPAKAKPIGKTACGGPIDAPFDKEAYLSDTAPHGEIRATGELFGGEVRIDELVMTRAADPSFKASVDLDKFDLGAAARLFGDAEAKSDGGEPPAPLEGVVSGALTIDKLRKSDYSHAVVAFTPRELSIQQGGQHLALKSTGVRLAMEDDAVQVPPLEFELRTANGVTGKVTVGGSASKITRAPELDLRADLAPIDLGILAGSVPRLQRAQGTLAGGVHVTGKALSPNVDGKLSVKGGDFSVQGLPSPITNVDIDVEADASEVRIVRGSGRFAGGTLGFTGRLPLRGFSFGAGELGVAARGVRFAPDDGVRLVADADLTLMLAAADPSGARSKLPHVSGDVVITSFEYTRPMALTGSLGDLKTRRASVDSYDPSLDSMTLDVNVRAKNPLRIHNNMIEAQLIIDSGVLQVTGTNQRIGLRGELKSMPGGRFHFRSSDFEVRQALLRFDDPTRIAPNVDVVAITEYRRMGDSANVATGIGRQAGLWRITLHAYGEIDNLHLDMTSDPPLSQEDIVLLLTIGMTRAEVDQLQAGALGAGAALEALAAASGADRAVKKAVPVIDDFRFGSAYSSRTGRTEPQVTLGKRITDNVRANVTTSLAEDRELRSNVEWRLNQRWSVQGSYDNINDVTSSTVGNVGVDVRWRVEFR
jgi:translocation and assembly module TamB